MNATARPVALVTGGSRGIGRATALRLAQDGFDIALCYRVDTDAAKEVEANLLDLGRKVYVRRADVSDPDQVSTLVAGAQDALGPITVLVASAAILRDIPLVMMGDDDWDAVLRVNLGGVYRLCRAVVDDMIQYGRGSIVTMSSLAGIRGNAGQANYAASKAGIIGFTKSLAQEVGPYGVRANVVAPGFIATQPVHELPQELREQAVQRIALRRFGAADDVADLVSYLVSDRARYVTGTVVTIDGGFQ